MNIGILSDLHFEHFYDHGADFISKLDPTGVDILALCGDIIPIIKCGTKPLEQLAAKFKEVVFVKGNHSLWSGGIQETIDTLNNLNTKLPNFHYLENNSITINGQRFLGATLWFDEQATKQADPYSWRDWSDFIAIKGGTTVVSNWIFNQNRETIDFLTANLQEEDVALFHHLPSFQCVAPKFKGSRYNCYFANNLDYLILERQPRLIVHGHTHCSVDLTIGKTRVIANPYGYHNKEENQEFNPNLIVKV